MNANQIKTLCHERGILASLKTIEECIHVTAQKYNNTPKEVEDIIITFMMDEARIVKPSVKDVSLSKNFIDEKYDVTVDDQQQNEVKFSEQEYLNRDFRKIVATRFPVFDAYSYIPTTPQFRRMPYWQIQKYIRDKLSSLEGINWSNQTLSYARNNVIGKHIIECLVFPLVKKGLFVDSKIAGSKLPDNLNVTPHVKIVDATGNIGMDSITFALEKFVSHVTTYEILPEVYDMLLNNIKLYGMNSRITAYNKRFDYNPSIMKDALVMIDPPYESGNNSNNFNLSIDSFPIYFVAQKILDAGAKCVILTMPKTYRYNSKFARDHNQYVSVYQMGNKNNKLFLIMNMEDANRISMPGFGTFTTITADESQKDYYGKIDQYKCKTHSSDEIQIKSPPRSLREKLEFLSAKPRLISGKINIKMDIPQKKNILTKVFGKDVKFTNNTSSAMDIQNTLKFHMGTVESEDKWGFNKTVASFSRKNAQLLKFVHSDRIIQTYMDIGCGSGVDMVAMMTKYTIKKGICADIKDMRIDPDKSDFLKVKPRTPLDVPDNSVDLITIFHTLHHVQLDYLHDNGMVGYFSNIHRVAKKGAIVLIKDHDVKTQDEASNVDFEHACYTISSWKKSLPELLNNYGTIEPMIYYSADEIISIMESLGFKLLWTGVMSKLTYIYGVAFKKM